MSHIQERYRTVEYGAFSFLFKYWHFYETHNPFFEFRFLGHNSTSNNRIDKTTIVLQSRTVLHVCYKIFSNRDTMNNPKKPGFNLYQSRHCAYITSSVKNWFLKNLSVFQLVLLNNLNSSWIVACQVEKKESKEGSLANLP